MLFRNDDKKSHFNPKTASSSQFEKKSSTFQQDDPWNADMERALLLKSYQGTAIVGMLVYKGEIKGIRFYDAVRNQFMDIAPWHLNSFSLSKLKLMGIRQLELFRHEHGDSSKTLLIEFLTKYEIEGQYRPLRMISNQVVEALSKIEQYIPDQEFEQLTSKFRVR